VFEEIEMKWIKPWTVLGLSAALSFVSSAQLALSAGPEPSHKQARHIAPNINGRNLKLETFCLGPDSNLWMCCAGSGENPGMLMVYSADGEQIKSIPLSFLPQAINFSPEGTIFVAGSGKIAKMSKSGEIELMKDLPNVANREEVIAKLKKKAEEDRKRTEEAYAKQMENLTKQIEKLEQVPEDETDKAKQRRERRLRILNASLEQFKENQTAQVSDAASEYMLSQMGTSTGIAASEQDVFVSCTKTEGFGYNIWRMNHELEEPEVVVSNVGGCCGQLDIQSDGEHLIIAENTRFEVGFYDRDGKRLHGWGKRARGDEGFGSCCNPMNVRCCANGDILTAESSIGHIKRFNQKGELLSFIGTAKVAGGCKHVAIGFDSDRNYHYMMNEDRSHVAVLIPKEQAPGETEDEKIAREAMQSMGKFLFGTWELEKKVEGTGQAGMETMESYIQSGFGHLEFAPDGTLVKGPKVAKAAKNDGDEEKGNGKSLFGALLSAVTGSDEQADAMLTSRTSEWKAIQAKDGKFDIITVDEGVQGFGATVNFKGDDEAEFGFFYGDPSQGASYGVFVFKRTSLEACGKDCSSCSEKCAKPEAKTDVKAETEEKAEYEKK
jgi:hypothetical protein